MSVYQTKDGRWLCHYPKGRDPERPTTIKKYFGRGTDAQLSAMRFEASIGLGARKIQKSPIFSELVVAYLDARLGLITQTTAATMLVRLKGTILPSLGHQMAHNLTPETLDLYVAKRIKTVKRTTAHREVADVRAVVRWAVKRKLIASNPMENYDMPRLDNARIMPPTAAEISAIIKNAVPHVQRAIQISYYTGLRPGREELLSLKWDAVDFFGRKIMVTSAEKGGIPTREVPMVGTFYKLMEKWFDEDAKTGTKYLVSYQGEKVESLKTGWKNAKKRARITRRLRMYDIRHAFATVLLENGGDLKTVSELLGHKSPAVTMKYYQHVSGTLKIKTMDLLESAGGILPHETDSKPL